MPLFILYLPPYSFFPSTFPEGDQESKYRLWAAAVFGYVFAAYFMQLLYAEYNNFSVRRLQYLVQVGDVTVTYTCTYALVISHSMGYVM